MAMLAPMFEIVLEGVESGFATNMGKEIYDYFAPEVRNAVIDITGKKVGKYAREHPSGFVNKTLEKSYQYSKLPAGTTTHSHRHPRRGHRRTH